MPPRLPRSRPQQPPNPASRRNTAATAANRGCSAIAPILTAAKQKPADRTEARQQRRGWRNLPKPSPRSQNPPNRPTKKPPRRATPSQRRAKPTSNARTPKSGAPSGASAGPTGAACGSSREQELEAVEAESPGSDRAAADQDPGGRRAEGRLAGEARRPASGCSIGRLMLPPRAVLLSALTRRSSRQLDRRAPEIRSLWRYPPRDSTTLRQSSDSFALFSRRQAFICGGLPICSEQSFPASERHAICSWRRRTGLRRAPESRRQRQDQRDGGGGKVDRSSFME